MSGLGFRITIAVGSEVGAAQAFPRRPLAFYSGTTALVEPPAMLPEVRPAAQSRTVEEVEA